jgi:flagellar hook-basal body complex protein FliE
MATLTGIGGAAPLLPKDLGHLEAERPSASGGASFADALGKAIAATDRLQVEADGQAAAVAQGGGNLHETAIALEKADVSLRVAAKVRNKVVEAYQEIMRMPV